MSEHQRATREQRSPQRTPEQSALEFSKSSQGQPLEPELRAALEPRFNHDFSQVRVYADSDADSLARQHEARAMTLGQDIYFQRGAYQPQSELGVSLIAHELAHTVQQSTVEPKNRQQRGTSAFPTQTTQPGDATETEARAAGKAALQGQPVNLSASSGTAVVARETPEEAESGKSIFERLGSYADLAESISHGRAEMEFGKTVTDVGRLEKLMEGEETMGKFGDVFNVYKGGEGLYNGFSSMYHDGLNVNNGLDATKGALDTVTGYAGLMGNGPLKGGAGMVSASIDVGRGLHKAISSRDVGEATEGAYQAVEGIGSGVSSFGDATKNPFLMAGGRAFNAGMAIGKPLVAATDRHAVNANLFQDEYGEATTGSHAAGNTGRAVQDYLHSTWMPDVVGDVAGGVTAIGAGIGNAAYSGVHAVGSGIYGGAVKAKDYIADNVTLDPDEIDWGRTFSPWDW